MSSSSELRIAFTVGICSSPLASCAGTMSVRCASTRIAKRGAWAAFANSFSDCPTDSGFGSTRWNVFP